MSESSKSVYAVMDGATGLTGQSGKLAANLLKKYLTEIHGDDSLFECVTRASKQLNAEVSAQSGVDDVTMIPKENRSTSGLAAIRLHGSQMEFVHAGDCMIFLQYKNKEVRTLTYDHLSRLDAAAIQLYEAQMNSFAGQEDPNAWDEAEISKRHKQVRDHILTTLVENRRKLNTPDGYSVIDGSDESLKFLEHGTLSLNNVESILLLSDGLQLPSQKGLSHTVWRESAQYAFANGLNALLDEVNRLESSDPACFLYPRFKYADDKTGILVQL